MIAPTIALAPGPAASTGMPAVPIRTRRLEDVNETLNDLRAGKIVGRVVLTPAA